MEPRNKVQITSDDYMCCICSIQFTVQRPVDIYTQPEQTTLCYNCKDKLNAVKEINLVDLRSTLNASQRFQHVESELSEISAWYKEMKTNLELER